MLDIMEQITQVRIDRKENSKRFSDNTIPQLKLQQLFFTLLTYIGESSLDKQPHDPAAEIFAFENGFNDSGYFARLFKRHYGVTPHQWRNK